ncbi:endo-beta-1,4-glucanase, partial [Biomphalaria glabrata]
ISFEDFHLICKLVIKFRGLVEETKWICYVPTCNSFLNVDINNNVLLYKLTKDKKYLLDIEKMFYHWLPGGTIHYTPKGLAYKDGWGTLRYT